MYNNIGKKIKVVAIIIAAFTAFAFFCVGAIEMKAGDKFGLIYICIGPVVAWLSSFLLYGFGQLVSNSDRIVRALEKKENTEQTKDSVQVNKGEKDGEFRFECPSCSMTCSFTREEVLKKGVVECPWCSARINAVGLLKDR